MKPLILHLVRVVIVSALVLGVNTLGHSQPRVRPDFRHGIDSLRHKSMPHRLLDDMLSRTGFDSKGGTLPNKALVPHSQFYVIDTAVVRCFNDDDFFRGDTTRHLYSYNAGAKRTTHLTQTLTAEQWVDSLRHTNSYDANNNLLSSSQELWSNGQWVPAGECYTFTYDVSGNMLSELRQGWENGQLTNYDRTIYTYDASGNVLSSTRSNWAYARWFESNRATYTYDASNNMLSIVYWVQEYFGWFAIYRNMYTYDARGNRLSMLIESAETGKWVTTQRETYTYDAQGNMLTKVGDDSSYTGVGHGTHWYTYDANGNRLSDSSVLWVNGELNGASLTTYTYDAQGNMLTESEEHEGAPGQWSAGPRRTYTYDAQGNLSSLWYHSWNPYNASWIPYPTVWLITDSSGNHHSYYGYNVTFTHKLIVTGVASESGNMPATYSLYQNYPNPFNPRTVVGSQLPVASNVKLVVYDVLGREVAVLVNERRAAGSYQDTYDGRGLASGVYIYRFIAGSFVQSRTMILLK